MNSVLPSPFDQPAMDALVNTIAEPGYGIFPNLVSLEVQKHLTNLMDQKLAADELVRAGVGAGPEKQIRSEIRSDSIIWLEESDPDLAVKSWISGMDELSAYIRRELFLSVWTYEGHLARYPGGGFYKPHLDQHADTLARQISIITYLNDDWLDTDGGQLRIYTDLAKGVNGPYLDVLPKAGTVVVFRSGEFWHEVLPSKRPRLSLTGWFRGRD